MEHVRLVDAPRAHSVNFGRLSVERLSVNIAGQLILDDVSLEVCHGEVVGLLGCDGAGKTSCFDAIAGLLRTSGGRVLLNGVDVTGWPADRRARSGLAYLSEEISIFRGLTVEENILAALELTEPVEAARGARLLELLREFRLEGVREQLATTVSGGERRRCEVARALALRPSIILLDEPLRGLDPFSIDSTKQLIAALKRLGIGVLISDYDMRDLVHLMDRAYLLDQGRVIFSGAMAALLSDHDVRELYLGKTFVL